MVFCCRGVRFSSCTPSRLNSDTATAVRYIHLLVTIDQAVQIGRDLRSRIRSEGFLSRFLPGFAVLPGIYSKLMS